MFHENHGLFFGRLANGDVRIVKTYDCRDIRPDNVVLDHVIPASVWASVIATCSKQGEYPNGGHDRALTFHNELECDKFVMGTFSNLPHCEKCGRTEGNHVFDRSKENAKAAAATEAGFPPLTGTEKMVAWFAAL